MYYIFKSTYADAIYMEAATIERIEELRYLISRDTHVMLKAKRSGNGGNGNVNQLERSISEMKREYDDAINKVKSEGFCYALLNEKEIDALHGKFMLLSQNEKSTALAGEGEGSDLIGQIDDILKTNAENKKAIAAFLSDLNTLVPRSEMERVKKFFEGYLDSAIFQLADDTYKLSLDLFVHASEDLDFACQLEGRVCELKRRSGMRVPSFDISSLGKFGKMLGGKVLQSSNALSTKMLSNLSIFGKEAESDEETEEDRAKSEKKIENKVPEKIEKKTDKVIEKVTEAKTKTTVDVKKGPNNVQIPAQPQAPAPAVTNIVSVANAAPAPSQSQELVLQSDDDRKIDEIDKKINVILRNGKMQRWVLGTFKDEAERHEYEKAQAILANLMKVKKDLMKKAQ